MGQLLHTVRIRSGAEHLWPVLLPPLWPVLWRRLWWLGAQHRLDPRQAVFDQGIESIQIGQQVGQIHGPDFDETLAQALHGLRKPDHQALVTPPSRPRLPDFNAVCLRRIQELPEPCSLLGLLGSQLPGRFQTIICRQQTGIGAEQLVLCGGQIPGRRVEGGPAVHWPEEQRHKTIGEDPQASLLGPDDGRIEGLNRVRTGIECDDHADKTADLPEVLALWPSHHVGTKTEVQREDYHEQPAVLGKPRDQRQRHGYGQHGTGHPQRRSVDRLTDGTNTHERHRKTRPIRPVPVHRQSDAVGDGHRQRGLDGFFCFSGEDHRAEFA